jgi:hypothetical protein
MSDFTPYQQKIIKRYYNNLDKVALQRLAELVTELYLAEGKKRERAWKQAASYMEKVGVPRTRVEHIVQQADVKLLAGLVAELQGRS